MQIPLISLASVVVAALAFLVWFIASIEIRTWLIPRALIASEGEKLIGRYGLDVAEALAAQRAIDAREHSDAYDAEYWDRVARWLEKAARTASKEGATG
jgi:hypothetical protein